MDKWKAMVNLLVHKVILTLVDGKLAGNTEKEHMSMEK